MVKPAVMNDTSNGQVLYGPAKATLQHSEEVFACPAAFQRIIRQTMLQDASGNFQYAVNRCAAEPTSWFSSEMSPSLTTVRKSSRMQRMEAWPNLRKLGARRNMHQVQS